MVRSFSFHYKSFAQFLLAKSVDKLDNVYMRHFDSGATRDSDDTKIDYDGFLSFEVLESFGKYMLKHQKQADGKLRSSSNWKKGIPRDAYMKSMWRHFHEVWKLHHKRHGDIEDALNALLFNVMGMLYEVIKDNELTEIEKETLLRRIFKQLK